MPQLALSQNLGAVLVVFTALFTALLVLLSYVWVQDATRRTLIAWFGLLTALFVVDIVFGVLTLLFGSV